MLKYKIHKTTNATAEERKMFHEAADEMIIQLNSEQYWREAEANYPYWHNKKIVNGYEQTFEQFKDMVMSGADDFNTERDNVIDISVTFYFAATNVIGYTYPTTWATWINRNVIQNFDLADIAGNQFHEYLHNLQLNHPNTNRKSVVYEAGYLMRAMVRDAINNPRPVIVTPVVTDVVVPPADIKPVEQPRVIRYCRKRVWYLRWLGKVCYNKVVR